METATLNAAAAAQNGVAADLSTTTTTKSSVRSKKSKKKNKIDAAAATAVASVPAQPIVDSVVTDAVAPPATSTAAADDVMMANNTATAINQRLSLNESDGVKMCAKEGVDEERTMNSNTSSTTNETNSSSVSPSSSSPTSSNCESNGGGGGCRDPATTQIDYVVYVNELQMPDIMRLIQKDLSEPYSIYTYRYFIHNWPKLCFLAMHGTVCVGAIVCKLDIHRHVNKRGYIAMLAVDKEYRKLKIGTNLVQKAIEVCLYCFNIFFHYIVFNIFLHAGNAGLQCRRSGA